MASKGGVPRVGFASNPAALDNDDRHSLLLQRRLQEQQSLVAGLQHDAGVPHSASMPVLASPTHRMHNAQYVIDKLVHGGIFLKHSYKGKSDPHHRMVWCSNDLAKIQWGDLNKKKVGGSLQVDQLLRVLQGAESKAFVNTKVQPKYLFSLQFKDRTLDLQCVSQQDRDSWVLAFNYLLHSKTTGLTDSDNLHEMKQDDVNRKHMDAASLADEVHLLTKRLAEAQQQLERQQEVIRKLKSDPTSEVAAPGFHESKMYQELLELRESANTNMERANTATLRADQLEKEASALRTELARIRAQRESLVPEAMRAELQTLRAEVNTFRLRNDLGSTVKRADFVSRLHAIGPLQVPLNVLPQPDPAYDSSDEETSGSEEEAPAAGGGRRKAGRLQRKLKEKARLQEKEKKRLASLMEGGVALNGRVLFDPSAAMAAQPKASPEDEKKSADASDDSASDDDDNDHFHPAVVPKVDIPVNDVQSAIKTELLRQQPLQGVEPEAVDELIVELFSFLDGTQTAGDAFAALNWVVGLQEQLVVAHVPGTPPSAANVGKLEPTLIVKVDSQGVSVESRHEFHLQDQEALHSGVSDALAELDDDGDVSSEDDLLADVDEQAERARAIELRQKRKQLSDLLTWVECTARFTKTVNFRDFLKRRKEEYERRQALAPEERTERKELERLADQARQQHLTGSAIAMVFKTDRAMARIPGAVRASLSVNAVSDLVKMKEEQQKAREKRRQSASKKTRLSVKELNEIRRNEMAEMQRLVKTKSKPKQWQLMDSVWLDSWKKFVAGGPRPGEISNWRLLDNKGNPRPGLKRPKDYRALAPATWKMFYRAYRGGPVITRKTGNLYKE